MLACVCRPGVLITLSILLYSDNSMFLLGLNFWCPWVIFSDNYVSMFLLGLDFSLQLNLSDQRRCVNLQISNHVAGIALCSNICPHCIVHPADWRPVKYFLNISARGIFKCEGGVVWWWWWFHHNLGNQWAVVSGSAGRREWCIVPPSDTRWRHLVGITHLPIQSPPSPSPLPSNKHCRFSINI